MKKIIFFAALICSFIHNNLQCMSIQDHDELNIFESDSDSDDTNETSNLSHQNSLRSFHNIANPLSAASSRIVRPDNTNHVQVAILPRHKHYRATSLRQFSHVSKSLAEEKINALNSAITEENILGIKILLGSFTRIFKMSWHELFNHASNNNLDFPFDEIIKKLTVSNNLDLVQQLRIIAQKLIELSDIEIITQQSNALVIAENHLPTLTILEEIGFPKALEYKNKLESEVNTESTCCCCTCFFTLFRRK